MTVDEMAAHLRLSKTAYWRNENGFSLLSYRSQKILSERFNVSMQWLLFNRGSIYFGETAANKSSEQGGVNHRVSDIVKAATTYLEYELKNPRVSELMHAMFNDPKLSERVFAVLDEGKG